MFSMSSPAISFTSDRNTTSSHASPDLHGASSPATSAETPPDDSAQLETKRDGNDSSLESRREIAKEEKVFGAADDTPDAVRRILETYSELAHGRAPSSEGDLTWRITKDEFSLLRRIIDEPHSRSPFFKAACWAGDKARDEYDVREETYRLRMTTALHDEFAKEVTKEVLSEFKETLRNHEDEQVRAFLRDNKIWDVANRPVRLKDHSELRPDGAITINGRTPPPFVVEVEFTNPLVKSKPIRYMNGTDCQIRCVLFLKIEKRGPENRLEGRSEVRREEPSQERPGERSEEQHEERAGARQPYALHLSLFQLTRRDPDSETVMPTVVINKAPIPVDRRCTEELTLRLYDFHSDLPETPFSILFGKIRRLFEDQPIALQESEDKAAKGISSPPNLKRPFSFEPNLEGEQESEEEVDSNTPTSPETCGS